MNEKHLTLKQNICAARVFLNTFGFILENDSDIDEFSKVKIYDKTMNEAGELYFDNGKVIIEAKYSKSRLRASYDLVKVSGFTDNECGNAIFCQWSSKIDFQIQNNNDINLNGEFIIENTIDSEYGISCVCHPLINCEIPNRGSVTIKILRNGLAFGLEIVSENYSEIIHIRPRNNFNGSVLHDIKKGTYNIEKQSFPYRKYAVINNGTEQGENKNKLQVFLNETQYDDCINYHNEFVPKSENSNFSQVLIQMGQLMQEIDSSMIKRIRDLQKVLLIDDISIFDNLISVCYDGYTDEALSALLGIKREKITYQDGADSLTNSYFGIGKDSQFLSLEQQKRLLKNRNT